MNSTTASSYPAVIVNGPIGKQIRLNSGYGCLGPSPEYPAGAALGRAMRFILMNVGGAIPGIGTMAIYGGPARYTGLIFAEDEDGIPKDWKPLNVERGFRLKSNTVTLATVEGTVNILGGAPGNHDEVLRSLNMIAGFISVPSARYSMYGRQPDCAVGILLMGRFQAQALSNFGWSKEKLKAYLWENSKIPWSVIERTRSPETIEDDLKPWRGHKSFFVKNEPWPITVDPKNIMIVVAGGVQSGHNYWMYCGNGPFAAVSAEIEIPNNFDHLLKQAEKELGSNPALKKKEFFSTSIQD